MTTGDRTARRLDRVRTVLGERDIAALLVGPGPDLRWLLGHDVSPDPRLTLLVVPAGATPTLVLPELEVPLVPPDTSGAGVRLRPWRDGEDPLDAVVAVAAAHGLRGRRLAVDDRLWTSFTLGLWSRLPGCRWLPGSVVTGPLRSVKEPLELQRLEAAAAAADDLHRQVPGLLRPGRTEREVARDLAELMRAHHDRVGFVIVAAGEHSASPHHEPSERPLRAGDVVLVDLGGVRDGYWSDCTRNYVLGDPPEGYAALHEVVAQAQHAAVSAVAPGLRAEEIDATARRVLTDAGWGEHILHRTGHGIGLEGHEPPWIAPGESVALEPGMVFSVEPGLYVPSRYGVRIEDVVVVSPEGSRRLNTLSRHPVTVPAEGGAGERPG